MNTEKQKMNIELKIELEALAKKLQRINKSNIPPGCESGDVFEAATYYTLIRADSGDYQREADIYLGMVAPMEIDLAENYFDGELRSCDLSTMLIFEDDSLYYSNSGWTEAWADKWDFYEQYQCEVDEETQTGKCIADEAAR